MNTNPSMAPKEKSGCGKYVAIGCAGMAVLMIIGGFLAYRGAKGFLGKMVEQYTDAAPLELPVVEVEDAEAAEVIARLDAFSEAVAQDAQPPALELSGQDLNVLINYHPDWTNLAGIVHITIEDDQINGLTSVPLGEFSDTFAGRYLNGSADFRVEMPAGRLVVFMDSIQVGDQPVPEEIMKGIRAENLAKDVYKDDKMAALLEKLESVAVRDGKLTIVPKAAPEE